MGIVRSTRNLSCLSDVTRRCVVICSWWRQADITKIVSPSNMSTANSQGVHRHRIEQGVCQDDAAKQAASTASKSRLWSEDQQRKCHGTNAGLDQEKLNNPARRKNAVILDEAVTYDIVRELQLIGALGSTRVAIGSFWHNCEINVQANQCSWQRSDPLCSWRVQASGCPMRLTAEEWSGQVSMMELWLQPHFISITCRPHAPRFLPLMLASSSIAALPVFDG